jgi:DNA-directed RNA polymerase specialized sigma24 family protein
MAALAPISIELLAPTIAGDRAAWQMLMAQLEPNIRALARSNRDLRKKNLRSPDDISEVTVGTFVRLAKDDFRNLRGFLDKHADSANLQDALRGWISTAVNYEAWDHIRRKFGTYIPPKPGSDAQCPQPSVTDLNTHAGRIHLGAGEEIAMRTLSMTLKVTSAQIIAHALEHFDAVEIKGLYAHYIEELSAREMAEKLGLASPEEADRLVRRVKERLRVRFRPEALDELV